MIKLRRRSEYTQWQARHQLDYVDLLEGIFSSVKACIAYLDLDFNVVRANEELAKLEGRRPEDLVGKNLFTTFTIEPARPIFEEVLRSGRPRYQLDATYNTPGRGKTYWNWSVQLLKEISGKPVGLLLICADVTEVHQAQRELQESRALFEHLFESDPDANILVDEAGYITALNHQAEMDFGYSREELLGKSIELLIPADLRQKHVARRSEYQQSPHKQFMGYDQQIYGRRKNGAEFPLEVTLSPLKTEKGTQILAVARDISLRKQLETDMAEVQHRLIESTETERLRLAQDLHDGPIQDLYGAVYMLQSLEGVSVGNPAADQVRGAHEAVSQVIETLRDICSELRPAALLPFGLSRAITSHAESFQSQFQGLTFHLHLDEDRTHLPEQTRLALYRIYQHLVSNVQRHAEAKNLWVRFEMGTDQIVLEVEDDGVGFNLPRRYVELVRKGHFGLAGATERAQAMGGNVEIITAPGKGTRIRIAVPAGLVYTENPSIPIQDIQ